MYSTVQYMNIYTSLHKCIVLQDGKATTNKFMQDLCILGVKSMTGNCSIFLFWAIFRLCWYLLCCLLLLFYITYSICDKFQIQVVWYAHVIYYKNSGHSQQLTHKFLYTENPFASNHSTGAIAILFLRVTLSSLLAALLCLIPILLLRC